MNITPETIAAQDAVAARNDARPEIPRWLVVYKRNYDETWGSYGPYTDRTGAVHRCGICRALGIEPILVDLRAAEVVARREA